MIAGFGEGLGVVVGLFGRSLELVAFGFERVALGFELVAFLIGLIAFALELALSCGVCFGLLQLLFKVLSFEEIHLELFLHLMQLQ